MSNCRVTDGPTPKSFQTNLLMQALFTDALSTFKDIADKYTEVCASLNINMLPSEELKSAETRARWSSPLLRLLRRGKYMRARIKRNRALSNKKRNDTLFSQILKNRR